MALRTVGARSGGAAFTVATVSWANLVTNMRFAINTNQDDSTAFGDEPNPKYEEGVTQKTFAFAGIMKEGTTYADPPTDMPQGVAISQTFSTGNSLSFTGNFASFVMERSAMQRGVIAGGGVVTGAVVKTWTTT
jgi:hypothetical protein